MPDNSNRTEAIIRFFDDFKYLKSVIGFERMEKRLEDRYPERPDRFWRNEDAAPSVLEFNACWILDDMIACGELVLIEKENV